MTVAADQSPAKAPGGTGWGIRPARTEDVPALAAAVAELLGELGGSPPSRPALEAEARAHLDDPSLGLILVAAAPPPTTSSHLSGTIQENCERAPGGEPRGVSGGPDGAPETHGAAGGELVGVLAASWARAIQVAGRLLTIEVLWTRREWRDRGVGAALVDALAAAAAAEGVARVEVGLPREGFPALRATERFYLANGFERLGPRMRRSVA